MTDLAIAAPAPHSPARAQRLAAFAAIYLFWGGTFLAIRYAVAEVPPLLTMALRCAGGALLLSLWSAWRGRAAPATVAQWRTAVVAGVLLFVGCHGVLAWAEQRVPSGQAALLLTSIPLWLVVLDALVRRRPPSGRVLAGLAVGVLGIAVLAQGAGGGAGGLLDRVALVASGLAWAAGSLVARHGPRPASAVQSTAMQLAVGAAALALGSLVTGELQAWEPREMTARAILALGFLILCGTTLAFAAYTWLLREATAAAVGTYAFVNPLVAVGLAWAAGDGTPSWRTAFAAALVIGAVLLSARPPEEADNPHGDGAWPGGRAPELGGRVPHSAATPALRRGPQGRPAHGGGRRRHEKGLRRPVGG